MAGEITIREARSDECGAVSAILLAAYAQYFPPADAPIDDEERKAWDEYRDNISDVGSRLANSTLLVAESDGVILGSVTYYAPGQRDTVDDAWPEGWASIRLLGVHPDARGRKVGRLLMDECMRRAHEAKATTMGLHTTQLMDVAREMYLRMGFQRFPEYDFYPTPDFCVEAYRLVLDR